MFPKGNDDDDKNKDNVMIFLALEDDGGDNKFNVRCQFEIETLSGYSPEIKSTSLVQDSEVICIQETWIEPDEENKDNLNLNGFSSHFTSIGKGKGIGTYYRDNFNFTQDVKKPNYQIPKFPQQILM